jgi:hypothetical protein
MSWLLRRLCRVKKKLIFAIIMMLHLHPSVGLAEGILFITHSSKEWDPDFKIRNGIEKTVQVVGQDSFHVVNLENFVTEQPPYKRGTLPADWYVTGNGYQIEHDDTLGGAHQITGNFDKMVFTGGNLTACLCRTLRDALTYTATREKVPQVYVVMDAVYEMGVPPGWSAYDFLVLGGLDQKRFPREMSDMDLFNMGKTVNGSRPLSSLEKISERMADVEFINFLRTSFIDPTSSTICLYDHGFGPAVSLTIFRNGVSLGKIGIGKDRQAEVHFITTQQLANELKK